MRETIISVLAVLMDQDTESFSDDMVIRDIDGFDSLKFVMMIAELQESYHIEVPLDRAIEVETIGELVGCARSVN